MPYSRALDNFRFKRPEIIETLCPGTRTCVSMLSCQPAAMVLISVIVHRSAKIISVPFVLYIHLCVYHCKTLELNLIQTADFSLSKAVQIRSKQKPAYSRLERG